MSSSSPSRAGGGGLWAFALGPIARELAYAIGTPLQLRWRPRWTFRLRTLGLDFRFGMRATGAELTYQVYSNLDYQIVAYVYGPAALGLYRAAYELVLEPVRFLSGIVTVVAFPAFARLRGDRAAIAAQFVAFSRQNLVVVVLVVAVIVAAAEVLLAGMFGASYAAAANAGRIIAVVGVLRALGHLGPPLFDGIGRPGLSLRYQVVAAATLTVAFAIAAIVGSSFVAIAVAWAVGYPIAFAAMWLAILAQLELGFGEYLRRLVRYRA